MANPEAAPKIDWSYYKSRVAVAGMVDNFQKQYESLKIPYPADTVTPLVEAQAKKGVSFNSTCDVLLFKANSKFITFNYHC
jgi:ATP synthase D chain, mitochondrial (ATP5H)